MADRRSTARPARRIFRALWRASRQVFHETTGTVFLLLALSWAAATLRAVAARFTHMAVGHLRRLRADDGVFAA